LGYRVIVKSVERIADHAVKIAENALLLDSRIDDSAYRKISEMSSLAGSVFDDSIKSLFKEDYKLADSVVAKAETIASMEDEAIKLVARKMGAIEISSVMNDYGEHPQDRRVLQRHS
jgi:phosphate uptake regulator